MDLGILLNDINGRLKTMDERCYNFGITINTGRHCAWNDISKNGGISNTSQYMDAQENNRSRLIIEPILAEPMDYVYLATLPKRAKIDDSLIKSSIPDTVMDSLKEPHKVLVYDDMGALTKNKNNTLLLQTPRIIAANPSSTSTNTRGNVIENAQHQLNVDGSQIPSIVVNSQQIDNNNSSTPSANIVNTSSTRVVNSQESTTRVGDGGINRRRSSDDDSYSTANDILSISYDSMLSLNSQQTSPLPPQLSTESIQTIPLPPPPPPPLPPPLTKPSTLPSFQSTSPSSSSSSEVISSKQSQVTRQRPQLLTNQQVPSKTVSVGQIMNSIMNQMTFEEELKSKMEKRRKDMAPDITTDDDEEW